MSAIGPRTLASAFIESLNGKFSYIMMMHDELVVHALMTKEFADRAGVRSYDDLVAKKPAFRLAVNTTGNMQSTYGMYMLHFGAYGVDDAVDPLHKIGVLADSRLRIMFVQIPFLSERE